MNTVAYNPNALRAYENSQHAADFGRIEINLFLLLPLAVTEACAGRVKYLKDFEYVCVTSQTHYAGAQQTFNAHLTHA